MCVCVCVQASAHLFGSELSSSRSCCGWLGSSSCLPEFETVSHGEWIALKTIQVGPQGGVKVDPLHTYRSLEKQSLDLRGLRYIKALPPKHRTPSVWTPASTHAGDRPASLPFHPLGGHRRDLGFSAPSRRGR